MIAFIEGTAITMREQSVIVAVSGLGLEVFAPRPTLERCKIGQMVHLETHFQVREDGFTLFGFHESDQLEVFKLLLSVSGVGPKIALAMLSLFSPSSLAKAIIDGDTALLSSTPGVGKKTAERLALELNNRLPAHLQVASKAGSKNHESPALQDAIAALVALGYREANVRGVVAGLLEAEASASTETLIRKALAKLR
jgi:holliday junction DNA helicase RuvA